MYEGWYAGGGSLEKDFGTVLSLAQAKASTVLDL